ncbi:CPBP family intramembrane metalloprotease [Phycicoccus sp. KQZ13P-1]|uniref:CPBP family intramembrane glutamic endopeptidase n=1 Tax=Phycicoccus mangrovi TaxID=2840470 RepID=UPI001C004C07|nr:CPBP family intramembrane glutamic endopeptidase [Phycicoccus mangrovi]MBT9255120.1 CPBP family intramembrane metalloprotease [Phycicoccus mangrovi]
MPRRHLTETWLVLGVSLGSSAIYALLRIVDRLTRPEALSQQTAAMNTSVTPDRPWLDVTYQLVGIGLALVPVLLALHLLRRDDPDEPHTMGFDLRRPGQDLWRGAALAAVVGIPGLGLYLVAKAVGLNTTVAAANLVGAAWFTVPLLVLAAAQNAVLEETIMVGYLFRRWGQAGWGTWRVIVISAVIRGSYHLYQGFGGFVGNVVMGLLFGWLYTRTKRVMPLVVAHTILDVVAFVGYALVKPHVSWL